MSSAGCCELPRVTRFLFCFSLRTGSLIIGYFSMFSALLAVFGSALVIFWLTKFVAEHKDNPPAGHTPEEIRQTATGLYVVYSLQILIATYYYVISLLLVIGAHKRRPSYMNYYVMAGLVNLVLTLSMAVISFMFTGFGTTSSQLITCAILFYFILVVRSAYLEMEDQLTKNRQLYGMEPFHQYPHPPPPYQDPLVA